MTPQIAKLEQQIAHLRRAHRDLIERTPSAVGIAVAATAIARYEDRLQVQWDNLACDAVDAALDIIHGKVA